MCLQTSPGETHEVQHKIKLTDETPIRCKPYPLLYAMREELRNQVDSMLEMGPGSGETLDIAVCIAHCHGEKEGWF